MNPIPRPPLLLACALTLTTMLAGCHATVDAQWATTDDTVYHWERAVPKLPIEVRGQLPDASNEQITHAIPNAISAQPLKIAGSSHASNDPSARLVVEVGNGPSPHDNAYCTRQDEHQTSAGQAGPVALTVTLCDGARLVASSRSPLKPSGTTVADLSRQVDRLKNLTLIGIARSPAQYTNIQG
ncbi:MAG TPA: hypothetical protein VFG49_04595 [Dyella sp.]|uniref:hypothetical protein n=1 Tax=Dyella sp. TaxID=1869338 RepID=UPI002D77C0A1|nr:hypothetical protein [Dyella sp.]HET6552797.1 hypothetical protein [Dyella sp.]